METRKFKTTAKCQGCVTKIAPFLNEILTPEQWSFDLADPDKVLIVQAGCPDEVILTALQKAGFKGEILNK